MLSHSDIRYNKLWTVWNLHFRTRGKNFSRRRLHSDIYMHVTSDFLKGFLFYTPTAFFTEANICTTQMRLTLA